MKTQLSGDVISIPEDPQVQPGLIQKRTALNEKYMYELFRSFRFNDTSSSKKIRDVQETFVQNSSALARYFPTH